MAQETERSLDNSSSDSGLSDDEHNVNIAEDKKIFLDKLMIFKMIHENRCNDGKDLSKVERVKDLHELKNAYDLLDFKLSFEEYVIRSSLVRWVTYEEDMHYWELWDKKEDLMKQRRRTRARERDRRRALDRGGENDKRSRSRSRSRSRIRDLADGLADGNRNIDIQKEQVR